MLAVHLEAFRKYVVRALSLFFAGEMHVFWSLGFPLVTTGSSAALSITGGIHTLLFLLPAVLQLDGVVRAGE